MKTTGVAKNTLRDYNHFSSELLTRTLNNHDALQDKNTPYALEVELLREFYTEFLELVKKYEARSTALEVMEPN